MSKQKPDVVMVINATHKLWNHMYDQVKEHFGKIERVHIPAEGLSIEEMEVLIKELTKKGKAILFVSPIPYVLGRVSAEAGYRQGVMGHPDKFDVWAFCADKRASHGHEATTWKLCQVL